MNNVAAEVMEEVAEVAVVNWKKVGIVGGSVIAAGTLVYLGVKKGVPWAKNKIDNRKAKKLEKKLKAAGDIEVAVK